jgi:hypothetical protein
MNKIIYTQDLPGERDWLASQFLDFENLETEFSGKWPTKPFSNDHNTIWEIPPESMLDVSTVDCIKYKSLYQIESDFISHRWCDSDQLLIRDLKFNSQPRSKQAQVLTFFRNGTMFLESILYETCGYVKGENHALLAAADQSKSTYDLAKKSRPDIFLCYRSDWWEWITSVLISEQFDYYHYDSDVSWEQLTSLEILPQDFEKWANIVRTNWQALCHFRTQFPDLNFYIFEFLTLIKNTHLTKHRSINYNKKNLINNYQQAKTLFETQYLSKFQLWEKNCVNHLQTMNCQIPTNFDEFIS